MNHPRFFKKIRVFLYTFKYFFSKKSSNRAFGTNPPLWPPICRHKSAITPKWFNSLDTNSRNYPKLIFHSFILEADAQYTLRIPTGINLFFKNFQSRLVFSWKKFDGIVSKCLEQNKLTLKCFLKDNSCLNEWDFHFQRIEILKREGISKVLFS